MRKKYFFILIFLVLGFTLTIMGIDSMFFKESSVYTTSTGRHPYQTIVANGTIELIVGLGFVLGGIIRWRNRNKIDHKLKREKSENWLKHY